MYYILASTKKPVIRRNLQTRVKYLHKHGLFPRRKVFSFPALTFPVSSSIIMRHSKCGRSSVAEHQLPKLNMRVRFPSPAPAASCRSQVAIITLWWSRFLFPAFLVWVHFYRVRSGKLPLPSRAPHFCGVRFFLPAVLPGLFLFCTAIFPSLVEAISVFLAPEPTDYPSKMARDKLTL